MRRTATVVGLGISGVGAALLLSQEGWKVRVTDEKDNAQTREGVRRLAGQGIQFEIGRHTEDCIRGSRIVVTSPGVRDEAAPLVWARRLGIPVIDEIELGSRFCPSKIIALTGTNGKSTTVTLIGELLKDAGQRAVVCGNIGASLCEQVVRLSKKDIAVLELSSFQLQRIVKFRPYVSLFLNITQNHFDRHKDFREYLEAKLNIFKNQQPSDWAVVNYQQRYLCRNVRARLLSFADEAAEDGAYCRGGVVYLARNGRRQAVLDTRELILQGEHNIKNAMAAILAASVFNVDTASMRNTLRRFRGLEHRFEFVDEIDGVAFINDSKATTVDAAMHAIRSVDKPVILIAGGRDKGSDFTPLRGLVDEKVKTLVLIGEARNKIRTQLMGAAPSYEAKNMEAAVAVSFDVAKKGDAVLLSPMCASFDMFKNFEERGEVFKKAVRQLKKKRVGPQLCRRQ